MAALPHWNRETGADPLDRVASRRGLEAQQLMGGLKIIAVKGGVYRAGSAPGITIGSSAEHKTALLAGAELGGTAPCDVRAAREADDDLLARAVPLLHGCYLHHRLLPQRSVLGTSPLGRAIDQAHRCDSSPYHEIRVLHPALTIPVYERPNRILRKPAHRGQGRGSGAKLYRLDGHGLAIEPRVREEDHLFTHLRGPAVWEQDCYLLPGRMSERLR